MIIILILVGAGAILLGAKGFTGGGLPLTTRKNLTGTAAKTIGVICILIGVAFISAGLWLGR